MEFKTLEELKNFLDNQEPKVAGEYTTREGIDKQFKNKMFNNACILYAVVDVFNFWNIEKFYCDKNGVAITQEKYENEKGM